MGDSLSWSAGNSGCRLLAYLPSEVGKDVAAQCAKNCPSYTEIKMYLGAGTLFDDGHTGDYQQAYVFTDPDTGEKTAYHAGVWVKKKQYIEGFDEGTAPQADRCRDVGRPTADNIDQYFFLPLYGLHDITNYNNPSSGSSYHHRILNAGSYGYFQSRTGASRFSNTNARMYVMSLSLSGKSASATTLNWTANNHCGTSIWTVD